MTFLTAFAIEIASVSVSFLLWPCHLRTQIKKNYQNTLVCGVKSQQNASNNFSIICFFLFRANVIASAQQIPNSKEKVGIGVGVDENMR